MCFLVVGSDEVDSAMILSINNNNYEVMTATNTIDGLIQTYAVKEDRATTDLMLILDDVFRMTTLVVIQNLIPHSNSSIINMLTVGAVKDDIGNSKGVKLYEGEWKIRSVIVFETLPLVAELQWKTLGSEDITNRIYHMEIIGYRKLSVLKIIN